MNIRVSKRNAPAPPERATEPKAGLSLCDVQGNVWRCEAVIRNGDVADYYLVRLVRVDGRDVSREPLVLSPSEYAAFHASRGLRRVLL